MKTLNNLKHLGIKVAGDISVLKERTYFLRMRKQEFIYPRKNTYLRSSVGLLFGDHNK